MYTVPIHLLDILIRFYAFVEFDTFLFETTPDHFKSIQIH